MPDKITKEFLQREYVELGKSTKQIAEENGTYPNRINRALKQYGFKLRTKQEALKLSVKKGVSTPPVVKGDTLSEAVKSKIAKSCTAAWAEISPEERERRTAMIKLRWDEMPDHKKKEFFKLAQKAVHHASRHGSKLEHYICQSLIAAGYRVEFHVKGLIPNEDFEVDIFLPKLRLAIEIDGLAHLTALYNDEHHKDRVRADSVKNGLLINQGFKVIRVKVYINKVSRTASEEIFEKLIKAIEQSYDNDKRILEVTIGDPAEIKKIQERKLKKSNPGKSPAKLNYDLRRIQSKYGRK